MAGLMTILMAIIPFAMSAVLARYFADTEKDAWLILCIGILGAVAVFVLAAFSWCIKKSDGEEPDVK